MEIQAGRDLLKDDYGNYYIVSNASGDSLTIINAALYYAFNQLIDEEFVNKARKMYPNEVACGKFFADQVMQHIEELEKPDSTGSIFPIEEVKKRYDLHVKPIYDDSFHM
ncbi:hypothetical protein [Planococcus beigongshangi]|uniref:hypothetical protein n=1 Tax=Planococcus beigongshangi TaxID=2782536 RepID=UPI00193B2B23|nr:hypothetical protein [Planococcus beigongshangi]